MHYGFTTRSQIFFCPYIFFINPFIILPLFSLLPLRSFPKQQPEQHWLYRTNMDITPHLHCKLSKRLHLFLLTADSRAPDLLPCSLSSLICPESPPAPSSPAAKVFLFIPQARNAPSRTLDMAPSALCGWRAVPSDTRKGPGFL